MKAAIEIPAPVSEALKRLEVNGYEAYVVGGCVRDSLLGVTAKDWDITTNARPDEIARCFEGYRVHETGKRFGTMTVVAGDLPLEITTYRSDGSYSDGRRPDSVSFADNIRIDLARRDFTVNAMAYHPQRGLCDYFGGREDLERRSIRCVGQPELRFREDALRILRALRFAARLGFALEERTAQSIRQCRTLLRQIAPERIGAEFVETVIGKDAPTVLESYSDVFSVFVPEIEPMIGLEQHNRFHHLDVWRHTLTALYYTPPTPSLRLAVLFHDAGKPTCFTVDSAGVGHFPGHPEVSARLASERLSALRLDRHTISTVETLIRCHDDDIAPSAPDVKRWLGRLGPQGLSELLEVKRADCLARNPALVQQGLEELERVRGTIQQVLETGQCFDAGGLQIDGNDLKALGFAEGRQIGAVLSELLEAVIDGKIANQRDVLLDCARRLKEKL